MKNSKKLKLLQVGDSIIFADGEQPFVVQATNYRYALACTKDGSEYTIVDKKDEIVASTNYLLEKHSNFNRKENTQKMLDMLHSGERELSKKYRDSFSEWDAFQTHLGSEVILAKE